MIGTTTSQGKHQTSLSKNSRPATPGNKRIVTRSKPQSSAASQMGKTGAIIKRTLTGPTGKN